MSLRKRILPNRTGESLIQVLVVLGILGIVMSGFLSMTVFQQNEAKALAEKIGAIETSRIIVSALSNSSACNALLNASNVVGGSPALTFDASPVTATSPNIIGVLTVAGLAPGMPTTSLSQSLIIDSSQGIQLSVTSPTTANLLVKFDNSKLVRAIKLLTFPIQLQSTGPITSTTITGCNVTWDHGSVGKSVFTSNSSFTVPDGVDKVYVSLAGGGAGGSGGSWNASDDCGGAGGGGGEAKNFVPYPTTPGAIIPVTVGAGGAGGGLLTSGGGGGVSSFGTLSALGGLPGLVFGTVTYNAGAARPGASSGLNGGCGNILSNTHRMGGAGGITILGLYGAGGSGGYSNNRGGGSPPGGQVGSPGRDGVVIVEW